MIATSSSVAIDRNSGVIRTGGMGLFPNNGAGHCERWERPAILSGAAMLPRFVVSACRRAGARHARRNQPIGAGAVLLKPVSLKIDARKFMARGPSSSIAQSAIALADIGRANR